jgi:hypothetical protein
VNWDVLIPPAVLAELNEPETSENEDVTIAQNSA